MSKLGDILLALPGIRSREGRMYLHLLIRNGLSLRRPSNPSLPRSPQSLLFVCQGNIIRSPFAAHLFPHLLQSQFRHRIRTASAGLDTTPGKAADSRAIQVAGEFGVSLEAHRTQRLAPALVEGADLILAMDTLNVAQFLVRYPASKNRLYRLGDFCDGSEGRHRDIQDPFGGGLDDVRQCYQTIAQRLSCLATALTRPQATSNSPNGILR